MKFKVFKFKNVSSTNDVAINLIKKDNEEIGCVYSEKQKKGRGTQGKKWISEEGNLFATIFFQLRNNFPPFNEFSIINPVIVAGVIEHYCKKKNISLKWPNDVFVNGKKICGILQEQIMSNNKSFLVIGIGINIVSNPKINNKYQATNILSETKKKPPINEVVSLIISSYESFFVNINIYNYTDIKKKAELMALN